MAEFKKAEKKDLFLKIAITGPSGSGKTMAALVLATSFGKKVAVVDSENKSASLYANKFSFDVLDIEPPYLVPKLIEAIKTAEGAGYDALVVDSLTHYWAGSGGLLDKKDNLDKSGKGNSYTNWASITKEHELLLATLVHAKIHLIGTMRSKQGYSLEESAGKRIVRKVGMEPIQRDGMEYEFTTVFDLGMSHHAQVSKDRTDLFDDQIFKIDDKVGKALLNWIKGPQSKVDYQKQVEDKRKEAAEFFNKQQAEADNELDKALGGQVAKPAEQKPSAGKPQTSGSSVLEVPGDAKGLASTKQASNSTSPAGPGDYVIDFSNGFKGRRIKDVQAVDLLKLVVWCQESVPRRERYAPFLTAVEKYEKSVEGKN